MERYTLSAPFGLELKVEAIISGDFYWAVKQHGVWVCSGESCSRKMAIGLGENALLLAQIHSIDKVIAGMGEIK